MKKKDATTFAFLLNYLNINVLELSTYLHLERSSISKWKSGAREINERTLYLNRIIDFFIFKDSLLVNPRLHVLFSRIYNKEIENNKNTLKKCTKQFLTSKNIPSTAIRANSEEEFLYKSEFLVYRGIDGRKSAVSYLLNFMSDLSEPTTMYILDSHRYNWLTDDPDYTTFFFKKIKALTDYGHELIFIHYAQQKNNNSTYSSAESIAYKKNIQEFFVSNEISTYMYNTIYLIKNKISMFGFDSSKDCDDMFSSMYFDQFTVMQHQKIVDTYFSHSKPVYAKENAKKTSSLLFTLKKYRDSYEPSIYIDCQLPISTMPKKLLDEILADNNVESEKIEKCFNIYNIFSHSLGITCSKQLTNQLYFLDDIEKEYKKNRILNLKLSSITSKKIYVTHEQLIRHYQYISELLQNIPNMKISLSNSNRIYNDDTYSIFCKKNIFVSIFDFKTSTIKTSHENFIVDITYSAYEKHIAMLPFAYTDNYEVAKIFLDFCK